MQYCISFSHKNSHIPGHINGHSKHKINNTYATFAQSFQSLPLSLPRNPRACSHEDREMNAAAVGSILFNKNLLSSTLSSTHHCTYRDPRSFLFLLPSYLPLLYFLYVPASHYLCPPYSNSYSESLFSSASCSLFAHCATHTISPLVPHSH
jgi:hypothetical protein